MNLELMIELMKTDAFKKIYEDIKRENPLYWHNPEYIRDLTLRKMGYTYGDDKNGKEEIRDNDRGSKS